MKLALVSQEYPPETAHGGIATQTYGKAHGLAELGHQVHVISCSIDGRRHEYEDGKVRVTRIPGFDAQMAIHTEPARWITYSSLVAAELAALHGRVGLDLADFPEWGGEAYVHLLNRTEWNRLPTVVHLQGPLVMLANTIGWPERDTDLFQVGTMMERSIVTSADAVFSSSRCSAEWCQREYGLGPDVPVIHAGVDSVRFAPDPAPRDGRPTILFVGRVATSKGADVLVEAACRLAAEFAGLRLRLVGRGERAFLDRLLADAARRGFPELLDFAGQVPHDALPREFAKADVFAAPSRYEGGPGFVYLEAMACGLPVIACSGSGVTEVVEDGRTGVLIPPEDADSLTRALRDLLRDAKLRAKIGHQAREYVIAEANRRVCALRIEDFYRSVIGGTV